MTILTSVETHETAQREIKKTVRALQTYERELTLLDERQPYGSVAVSLPYNNPLYSLILYCGGPLLAGNTVVCRASRHTQQAVQQLYDILDFDVDLLPLSIDSTSSGTAFVRRYRAQEGADVFVFAGSWRNAEALIDKSRRKLIYCGPGLNPFVILQGADISTAVTLAVEARLYNSGQDCLAAERFYVDEALLSEFLAALLNRLSTAKVGDNADPEVEVGSLISDAAAQQIATMLRSDHPGRTILLKNTIVGATVPPHVVLTDASDPLVLAEKYAPIFVIVPFRTLPEAVELASDGGFLFGVTIVGPEKTAFDLDLPHPHIAINESLIAHEEGDAHVPFGGRGKSGFVVEKGLRHDGPILFSLETSCVRASHPVPARDRR